MYHSRKELSLMAFCLETVIMKWFSNSFFVSFLPEKYEHMLTLSVREQDLIFHTDFLFYFIYFF